MTANEEEWKRCVDEMPPDDETKIICRFLSPLTAPDRKCMGRNVWQFIEIRKTNPKSIIWRYRD